ncbi:2,4-dienoyl-CoA reductase [Quadrisphaera granulorum]|uniref:2,4-dienoyl-CoA reductase-like NADH-dependent reductase (Old Yellow Enzyme family) n=1 Tax=Quadrisphaera granulorum TaxID=317664 RepID=A0A316A833_9ACTN|nr:NAD(P)-binding protein [Quadrisphaera granulorum]PWJ53875.1 2,4-dienoyl-CoA reductase-like NADH-dependent reductase (Old Yellow Enzyme family) [Quadrisphaera granulorum]SZE96632.1 2,4-dienoyl-CoA reductase [Quadrisphaera granulorum]
MDQQWRIDEPVQVGPVTLPRRVFLPAHQPGLAEGGKPGERYIAYHRQRARAGAAMQITGATPVVASSQWSQICLWNVDESIVPGYQALASAVRAEGGRMLAQLAHPGPTEYSGPDVIGPSHDVSEPTRQVVVPATVAQLALVVEQYAEAADRCRRGELDGVEISMAHGMLLASFISPLTNHRDDEFGGDAERRLELPRRVLAAVREAIGPDLVLGLRLGVDDMVDGGLRPAEAALVARALEPQVDYISVMVGNNNRLEARVQHWPPTPAPPGTFRATARVIREAVTKPVAAVGRVLSLDLANDMVVAGDADLVGMVRAQIADGELISKSRAGRSQDVRPCVGANVCVNGLLADKPLGCMVNADARTSSELGSAPRLDGARAVVVGAGPAGLESARRLAERGAAVVLFEEHHGIGGQLAQWAQAPSRQEFFRYVEWQQRQLAALGVDLRTGARATAADVVALSPDLVVLATGSRQVRTAPATDDGSVSLLTPAEAFEGPIPTTTATAGSVVVYDEMGELDAALIAEYLHTQGLDVTLVTSRIHVGEGEGINTLFTMLRALGDRGIRLVERQRLVALRGGRAVFEGVFGGAGLELTADAVVGWSGGAPVLDLREELGAAGVPVVVIGDALRPRRVTDATVDAKQSTDAWQPARTGAFTAQV